VSTETLPLLLARGAAEYPQRQAVVEPDASLTYAELAKQSAARAAALVAAGVNRGHRVALQRPNGVDWVIDACAVMRTGAVLVPLSTLLKPAELQAQLAVAGVRHLLAAPAFRGRRYREEFAAVDQSALPSLRNVWWTDTALAPAGTRAQDVATALEQRVAPADDMVVIFTSGSSGAPKGVIHTHGGAIRANAAGLAVRCIHAGTRLYLPMPLFWAGGFAAGLLSALNAGATLLTEAEPEPGHTLAFLARAGVTLFRGWPDQAAALAAHPDFAGTDLSSLAPGSLDAVLPAALRGSPGSRANLFGMTESFGPYCGYPLDRDMPGDKWGSCGQPFEGMRVRIVDPGTSAPLPVGATGAIHIGGRNILRGICGREREEIFTADGWYDTGDLGMLDADGFLYYRGRADDMIRISGATVYPAEVEAALQELPGVARACVVALALEGGIVLGAAVLPEAPGALAVAQLEKSARERLSAFKIPTRWLLLDSLAQLPRSATGKLDKVRLQSLILSASREQDPSRPARDDS